MDEIRKAKQMLDEGILTEGAFAKDPYQPDRQA